MKGTLFSAAILAVIIFGALWGASKVGLSV